MPQRVANRHEENAVKRVRSLARSHPESPGRDRAVPEAETSNFSISSRKARVSAESYSPYVAQGNPMPDDEIAKKCRFRTGTG